MLLLKKMSLTRSTGVAARTQCVLGHAQLTELRRLCSQPVVSTELMCSGCPMTYKSSGLRRPACWPSGLCVGCFAYVDPLCGLVSESAEADGACSLAHGTRVIFLKIVISRAQRYYPTNVLPPLGRLLRSEELQHCRLYDSRRTSK